jgi:hypothetical protein
VTREKIADRLITYADAAAAFAVVNSIAFLVALAQPDVRSSISNFKWFAILAQLAASLAITVAIVVLRRLELKAREVGPPLTSDVESFLRWFFIARLGIVGASTVGTLVALAVSIHFGSS